MLSKGSKWLFIFLCVLEAVLVSCNMYLPVIFIAILQLIAIEGWVFNFFAIYKDKVSYVTEREKDKLFISAFVMGFSIITGIFIFAASSSFPLKIVITFVTIFAIANYGRTLLDISSMHLEDNKYE